jgi:hypothetical protein
LGVGHKAENLALQKNVAKSKKANLELELSLSFILQPTVSKPGWSNSR